MARTGGRREEPFHGLPSTTAGMLRRSWRTSQRPQWALGPQRRGLAESPRRRGNLGIPPDPHPRYRPMEGRHPKSLRHPTDSASRRQDKRQGNLTCCAVIGQDRAAVPRNEHIHTSAQPQSALIPASGGKWRRAEDRHGSWPGKNLNKANSPGLPTCETSEEEAKSLLVIDP